jgi:hypothetical protein
MGQRMMRDVLNPERFRQPLPNMSEEKEMSLGHEFWLEIASISANNHFV